jgi:L-asparaginase II
MLALQEVLFAAGGIIFVEGTPMAYDTYQPIIEVTRGPIVESVHLGAVAVVDANGNLLASHGDPNMVMYLRSSAKPFQALPFVEMGGAEAYELTDREIAVMCASHIGSDEHVAVVAGMQNKIGLSESQLLCGSQFPSRRNTLEAMLRRGEEPTSNRNNCSGKHTGMLAQASMRGVATEDYIHPAHPVQQLNLQTFSEMCSVSPESVLIGVDGCSAPVYAIPLRAGAYGYARLCDPCDLPPRRAAACRRIVQSMTAQPEMVSGPEEFDTTLMQVGAGKIVSKTGAEGYQAIGLLPGVLSPDSPGIGITYKIADGDATGRARSLVGLEILRQLGVFTDEQMRDFPKFGDLVVKNWRKLHVGEMRPIFELTRQGGRA